MLLSGNHGAIAAWRREQQVERTRERRPDLLAGDDRRIVAAAQAPVRHARRPSNLGFRPMPVSLRRRPR